MKKVIAGCIDLMLEFDSASELDRYIADIVAKKQEYSIVERKECEAFPDGIPEDVLWEPVEKECNNGMKFIKE